MPYKHSATTAGQETISSNKQKNTFYRFFLEFLNLSTFVITEYIGDTISQVSQFFVTEFTLQQGLTHIRLFDATSNNDSNVNKLPISPLAEACPAKLAAERQSRKSTKVHDYAR